MNEEDRALMIICIERYWADIRIACMEDQDNADGAPGTVGNTMQVRLLALKEKVRSL